MTVKFFYLKNCPYCRKADRIIASLIAENSAYADVKFEKIEESEKPDIAESYNYFYVPCFFVGDKKMLEGDSDEKTVRAALDYALEAAVK